MQYGKRTSGRLETIPIDLGRVIKLPISISADLNLLFGVKRGDENRFLNAFTDTEQDTSNALSPLVIRMSYVITN